jgi:hypothetical protein
MRISGLLLVEGPTGTYRTGLLLVIAFPNELSGKNIDHTEGM